MRLVSFLALVQAALAWPSQSYQDAQNLGMEHADILAARNIPNADHFKQEATARRRTFCVIAPDPKGGDDGPQIMNALNNRCKSRSMVYLPGPTYHIKTNMTTLDMDDVQIIQFGRMEWSTDINYWLSVSMPIGFQNQSTVWYFGGNNITWDGWNLGTLDGNGQVWYDWAKSQGNLPRRPMNINFRNLTKSVIKRMRFVQSQMWTMAITHSQDVEMDDIYINSTSNSEHSTLNTDGCDTVYSDNVTFRRWFVTNGDDAIALKGNSSNISIYDSEFRDGQGVAIGSMGQYDGKYEYITDFYARNITLVNTAHVSYLKTWAGVSRGYPPNGGGGGLGHATNIVMEDIKFSKMRQQPFFAWQCENYSGWAGKDCNSSKFKLNQVVWRRVSGTVVKDVKNVGSFQCSAAAGGCQNITVADISVKVDGSNEALDSWHCENVHGESGFTCNDPPM